MPATIDTAIKFERLREQAELLLQKRPEAASPTPAEILELIHELRIHQVELEIQNEELKRAQQEITKLHQEYETLYEFAPCGYVTLDARGIITHINLTGTIILNTDRRYLMHSGLAQYIDPGWDDLFLAARKEAAVTNQKQSVEIRLRKDQHPLPWVRADIEAELDDDGGVIQWRVVLVDISDRRKAEDEQQKLEYQLRQAHKMETIGTLAGGIAHEFNNLLSIIIGNNEMVIDELPQWGPLRDHLEEVRMATMRASEVVKQLLTFSRQDDTEKKPLHIAAVVREALKLIRSSTPANIHIKQSIADGVDPILGNTTQINQLLINLCVNAIDAMQHMGGIVAIELSNHVLDETEARAHLSMEPGRYVMLLVTDDGCGMENGTLDRIFDPYFTTKPVGKGSGIGLAVVRGVVERHGGAIYVKSVPGKGTAFSVLFPAYDGPMEPVPAQQDDPPKGSERVLFVDDEPSILKMGKQRLKNLGYAVQGTSDPLIALELFRADPDGFDLVITDMAMPGMTGDALATEILSIRPNMPIMLCTGYSEAISEKEACEIGICSFVMKPLDRTTFAHSIRKVLDDTKS